MKDVPLSSRDAQIENSTFKVRAVTDTDEHRTLLAIQKLQGFGKATLDPLRQAIDLVANDNNYHPVRHYLESLTWDGVERLSGWLKTIGGCVVEAEESEVAQDNPYLSSVSRLVLVSAVKRIFEPGCKADSVLVLEGPQGVGKSRIIQALCPKVEWFSDSLPGNLQDKDARQHLQGKWIVEMAELASINRSTIEATKAFITAQIDEYRPPYGRNVVSIPRQCIFIATTNSLDWARDDSGNRRFLPVRFDGDLDVAYMAQNRDQLWAEAYQAFRKGEDIHLKGDALRIAQAEQSARQPGDPMTEAVLKMHAELRATAPATAEAIVCAVFGVAGKPTNADLKRVTGILTRAGYKSSRKRIGRQRMCIWWHNDLGVMPINVWQSPTNGEEDPSGWHD